MWHVFFLDGTEGAQPDMKEHFRDLHALIPDLLQQFRRKMKSRGRCGGGAVLLAVYRLIPLGIAQFFVDIGRKRHRPHAGEDILERAFKEKFHDALARIGHALHLERELLVDDELCPGTAFPARTDEYLPLVEGIALQKQDFHLAAVGREGEHARGQYPRAVENEHIACVQIIDDIAEDLMFDLSAVPVIDEKARRIPRLGGRLRDEFFRQIVPEV